mmetsp:Transcript_10064/g.11163  ORF Transcript_10064/g.11163 Transcript_10064/m.11163 type:complete len:191 (-) Transcript_10064:239-811(-)
MISLTCCWLISFTILLSSVLTTPISCFVPPSSSTSTSRKNSSSFTIVVNSNLRQKLNHNDLKSRRPSTFILSSKEEEIAELEAKLRQLKEDTEQQQEIADVAVAEPTISAIVDAPLEEMLSESWKEEEVEGSEGGSIVSTLVTGLVAVAALLVFSQIPIGQESLDKYSTPKPSTTIDLGDKSPSAKSRIY